MQSGKISPEPMAEFKKQTSRGGILHVGPAIGVLHRGLPAEGDESTPFQEDYVLPKADVPAGTAFIELVSVVAVLKFTNSAGDAVDVPLNALQTWSWCDQNSSGGWYASTQIEFQNSGIEFNWEIGLIQSFFFFGEPP